MEPDEQQFVGIAAHRIWDINELRAFMRNDENSDEAVFDKINTLFENWITEFMAFCQRGEDFSQSLNGEAESQGPLP
jgi:hypothetical protein